MIKKTPTSLKNTKHINKNKIAIHRKLQHSKTPFQIHNIPNLDAKLQNASNHESLHISALWKGK